MTESEFKALAELARALPGDYGRGYQRGLRRRYHGESFGDPDEHERWLALGTCGDQRVELGRGYRDGCSGTAPSPKRRGPPAKPEDERRDATIELTLTREGKQALLNVARDAGLSASAWVEAAAKKEAEAG